MIGIIRMSRWKRRTLLVLIIPVMAVATLLDSFQRAFTTFTQTFILVKADACRAFLHLWYYDPMPPKRQVDLEAEEFWNVK